MQFSKENILKGIKKLEEKRDKIQKELNELESEIRLEKMMLGNEMDNQFDNPKDQLTDLFGSFDQRLKNKINNITKS
tara:strand:- start:1197 stop:1427 length:231 start_codon:yes stop_codon:yes gene_type:complete